MKLIATLSLLAATAASLFGQGSVNFNNKVTGAGGVVAPIYGPNAGNPLTSIEQRRGNADTNGGSTSYTGYALLGGTGFTAELWGGADSGNLALVSNSRFRTGSNMGFIQAPAFAPTVAGVLGGQQAVFELRVWDNQNGAITTWAQVLNPANSAVARGVSDPIGPLTLATPPGTPPNLVGLTSFSIVPVPEPSLIALGALGLGALLLRRRKA